MTKLLRRLKARDVKETGDHETLMKMHGRYKALYNSQFA